MSNLRSVATRSLLWTAFGKLSNNLATLLVTAILTRLLTPADFGVIAMVAVFTGFLGILAEAGLSTAVVQKRDLSEDALSSLFWLGLIMGGSVSALLAAASPLIALFFGDPRLSPVVAVMGVGFFFVGLGRVPNGLLERGFRFREIAICETSSAVGGGVVGVVGALAGAGYWALVAQSLTSTLLNAVLRVVLSRWRPRRTLRIALVKEVTAYSSGVTAFSAINYWARNLDKALIGRSLGAAELGYYGRAYALMVYPLEAISGVLNPTLHPILSELQLDRPRMLRAYLNIARAVALIAIPVMTVMAGLAPEIVRSVWGPKWGPSIGVFSILCMVGAVQPVGGTFGSVFLATNNTRLLALSGLVNSVVMMAGIALGLRWGMRGVAIGYSCAYGAIFLPTLYWVVVGLLGGRVRDILWVLRPGVTTGLVTLGTLAGFNRLLRGHWADLPHLAVGLAVCVVVWALLLTVVERSLLSDVAELMPESLRARLRRWKLVR